MLSIDVSDICKVVRPGKRVWPKRKLVKVGVAKNKVRPYSLTIWPTELEKRERHSTLLDFKLFFTLLYMNGVDLVELSCCF